MGVMELAELRAAVESGVSGGGFRFVPPANAPGWEPIHALANDHLLDGELILEQVRSVSHAGDTIVIAGTGVAAPFAKTSVELTFYVVEGRQAAMRLVASAAPGWTLLSAFPSLSGTWLSEVSFDDSPTLTLQSHPDEGTSGSPLTFEGSLALEPLQKHEQGAIASSLARMLGYRRARMKGTVSLGDGGARLRGFALRGPLGTDGGTSSLAPLEGLALALESDTTDGTSHFLALQATAKVHQGGDGVPVRLPQYDRRSRFTVRPIEPLVATKANLERLLGGDDVLPESFDLGDDIEIDSLLFDFDATRTPPVRLIGVDLATLKGKTWPLFDLPGGRRFEAGALRLLFRMGSVPPTEQDPLLLGLSGDLILPLSDKPTIDLRSVFFLPPLECRLAAHLGKGSELTLRHLEELLPTPCPELRTLTEIAELSVDRLDFDAAWSPSSAPVLGFAANVKGSLKLDVLVQRVLGSPLPPGVPNGLELERLLVEVATDGSFRFDGSVALTDRKLDLEGTKLTLARLGISVARTAGGDLSFEVRVSGEPEVALTPDVSFDSYALGFRCTRKTGEAATSWAIDGHVGVRLFGDRYVRLAASYQSAPSRLTLDGKCVVDGLAVKATAFAGIEGITDARAETIFRQLQRGKHLDDRGRVSPKALEPGTSLGIGGTLEEEIRKILAAHANRGPFFTFAPGNVKLAEIDSVELQLSIERNAKGSKWNVTAAGSMKLFALVDEPFFTLKNGKLKLTYDSVKGDSQLSFEAHEAKWTPISHDYRVAVPVEGAETQFTIEDKKLQTVFDFKRISFDRKGSDKSWSLGGLVELTIEDLPDPLSFLFRGTAKLEAKVSSNNGLMLVASEGFEGFEIPDLLAKLSGDIRLPPVGKGYVRITSMSISVAEQVALETKLGIGLPSQLNDLWGPKVLRTYVPNDDKSLVGVKLTIGTERIDAELLDLPFQDIDGIDLSQDKIIAVDFDELFKEKGLGRLTFDKPTLDVDLESGALKVAGGFALDPERPLALTMTPLKNLLRDLGAGNIAERLPPKVPLDPPPRDPKALREWLEVRNALFGVKMPEVVWIPLQAADEIYKRLPERLQKYIDCPLPDSMRFRLEVTADGGVSGSIEVDPNKPLRILGPTATNLNGITITKLSFGTALFGSCLKVEASGEIDFIDYLSIAGSLLLLDDENCKKVLPSRAELQRTIVIDDLLMLIVIATVVPIPIPLFYRELAVYWLGIEGVEVVTSIAFPKPEVDFAKALTIISELKNLPTQDLTVERPILIRPQSHRRGEPYRKHVRRDTAGMNLVFSAGPLYLRLPKYLAGENGEPLTIGLTDSYELVDVLNLLGIAINSGKHLVTDRSFEYLIQSLHIEHRVGSVQLSLFDALNFRAGWALTTPAELVTPGCYERMQPALDAETAAEVREFLQTRQQDVVVSDDGLVVMLCGAFEVGDRALAVEAAGGIVATGSRFATALRLRASAVRELVAFDLRGLVDIRTEPAGVRLEGAAELEVAGSTVLVGRFLLTAGSKGAAVSMWAKAGWDDDSLPIRIRGSLDGRFSDEELYLEGKVDLTLWALECEAAVKVCTDSEQRSFAARSKTELKIDIGDVVRTTLHTLFGVDPGKPELGDIGFDLDFGVKLDLIPSPAAAAEKRAEQERRRQAILKEAKETAERMKKYRHLQEENTRRVEEADAEQEEVEKRAQAFLPMVDSEFREDVLQRLQMHESQAANRGDEKTASMLRRRIEELKTGSEDRTNNIRVTANSWKESIEAFAKTTNEFATLELRSTEFAKIVAGLKEAVRDKGPFDRKTDALRKELEDPIYRTLLMPDAIKEVSDWLADKIWWGNQDEVTRLEGIVTTAFQTKRDHRQKTFEDLQTTRKECAKAFGVACTRAADFRRDVEAGVMVELLNQRLTVESALHEIDRATEHPIPAGADSAAFAADREGDAILLHLDAKIDFVLGDLSLSVADVKWGCELELMDPGHELPVLLATIIADFLKTNLVSILWNQVSSLQELVEKVWSIVTGGGPSSASEASAPTVGNLVQQLTGMEQSDAALVEAAAYEG